MEWVRPLKNIKVQVFCILSSLNHTTEVAVGFPVLGLSTRLWAMSSRLILRRAVQSVSMLAQSLLAQSDRSARTGCSSCLKVAIRSSSYPSRPARLHQSLSSMWLRLSPSLPLNSSFSTFSLVWRGRSKHGSSSTVTTGEGKDDHVISLFVILGKLSIVQHINTLFKHRGNSSAVCVFSKSAFCVYHDLAKHVVLNVLVSLTGLSGQDRKLPGAHAA